MNIKKYRCDEDVDGLKKGKRYTLVELVAASPVSKSCMHYRMRGRVSFTAWDLRKADHAGRESQRPPAKFGALSTLVLGQNTRRAIKSLTRTGEL